MENQRLKQALRELGYNLKEVQRFIETKTYTQLKNHMKEFKRKLILNPESHPDADLLKIIQSKP